MSPISRRIVAAVAAAAISLLLFFSLADAQSIEVQKHYRSFKVTPQPELELTLRTEYHLMVGVERSASLVMGGVEGEPAPRMVAVIVGFNEFEGDQLCFTVDEIQGVTPPEMIGERACFVYDREADTMAPINDPDAMVLEDCGMDHTQPQGDPPGVFRS